MAVAFKKADKLMANFLACFFHLKSSIYQRVRHVDKAPDKGLYSTEMGILKGAVTFFGVGLAPRCPGTVGTLAAIPLCGLLMWMGPFWHMGVSLILFSLAIVACEMYERQQGGHDRSEIVIDEVVGYLITMVWMPLRVEAFVVGFLLFRFFDIVKPWPIRWMDQNIRGGAGVMIDDLAAGLVSNVIMQIILSKTLLFGTQIL